MSQLKDVWDKYEQQGFEAGLGNAETRLRDQFAMAALTGMMASPLLGPDMRKLKREDFIENVAVGVYVMAAAMLKEREK